MIDCHAVMKQLWEYIDGELPAGEAEHVAEHLAMCARCNPQYQFQLAFLASLVRAHARDRGPRPDFEHRVRAALATVDPSALD
jgi:anti-sigma factor RsiW